MLFQFQVAVRIPAPPEKVFQAFTDPEKSKKWYCADDMQPERLEIDVRKGGKYLVSMQILDETFTMTGEFRDVVPNEKLVFTQQWQDSLGYETLTTVFFRKRDRETDLLVTQENFKNEDDAEGQQMYWTNVLKGLANKMAEGVI